MDKLRVFEAFCGYGSQSVSLAKAGVNFEVVAISDIDIDVLISYGAIRGVTGVGVDKSLGYITKWLTSRNIGVGVNATPLDLENFSEDKLKIAYQTCLKYNCLGDIAKIPLDAIPDHDLFTYSFPCQDISVAGRGLGLGQETGTRSSLLWECKKIIEAKKPKYLFMENVKNLIGDEHKANFDSWCDWLEDQGYSNFYAVLNAKDYGIPQNRERVYMFSVLDKNAWFNFPAYTKGTLNTYTLLEDNVDIFYYMNDGVNIRSVNYLRDCGYIEKDASIWLKSEMKGNKYLKRTLLDKIVCEQRSDEGIRFFKDGMCGTIRAQYTGGHKRVLEKWVCTDNLGTHTLYTLRKFTPNECWNFMGMLDNGVEKCKKAGVSNSQLYRQAGNSIVINVLECIFRSAFVGYIKD